MKHLKYWKEAAAGAAAVLALTTAALAAPSGASPAGAVADVTGKSLEEIAAERQSGRGFCVIAAEAGALEDFREAVLALREAALAECVAEGRLTREQADARLAALRQRWETCDGTGGPGCGPGGWGMGCVGGGRGPGLRDGSCRNP